MSERRFPIHPTENKRGCGGSIPWAAVEKMRAGAEANHGQTLERLAERGGMTWEEMARAALGLDLFQNELRKR